MSAIKTFFKNAVERTAGSRVGWWFYQSCGRLSDSLGKVYGHAKFVRQESARDQRLARRVEELFPNLTVAHGPFHGMRYPAAQSHGSMLLPKLLGSYESELHPVIERFLTNDYSAVVDIGCAEGYYAVGLGQRFPRADVYAFDTSGKARDLCAEMAKLNGLERRIHIGSFCDEASLRAIPLGVRALIVSDCEGYEKGLFSRELAGFLANHDLIIEAHDFIDIEISPTLLHVFSQTHRVEAISSVDDIEKAHTYQYPELGPYSAGERHEILSERRPGIMRWLVMTSRDQAASV